MSNTKRATATGTPTPMPALAEAGRADGAEVGVDKASAGAELEVRAEDTLNKDPDAVGLEDVDED